ncbi:hypothetical protein LXL04_036438 [Taraxacum kok-saghyz]
MVFLFGLVGAILMILCSLVPRKVLGGIGLSLYKINVCLSVFLSWCLRDDVPYLISLTYNYAVFSWWQVDVSIFSSVAEMVNWIDSRRVRRFDQCTVESVCMTTIWV